MPNGAIKHYSDEHGHGMIEPSDGPPDVYFTRDVVEGDTDWLAPDVPIVYELFDGNGSPQASSVRRRTPPQSSSRPG